MKNEEDKELMAVDLDDLTDDETLLKERFEVGMIENHKKSFWEVFCIFDRFATLAQDALNPPVTTYKTRSFFRLFLVTLMITGLVVILLYLLTKDLTSPPVSVETIRHTNFGYEPKENEACSCQGNDRTLYELMKDPNSAFPTDTYTKWMSIEAHPCTQFTPEAYAFLVGMEATIIPCDTGNCTLEWIPPPKYLQLESEDDPCGAMKDACLAQNGKSCQIISDKFGNCNFGRDLYFSGREGRCYFLTTWSFWVASQDAIISVLADTEVKGAPYVGFENTLNNALKRAMSKYISKLNTYANTIFAQYDFELTWDVDYSRLVMASITQEIMITYGESIRQSWEEACEEIVCQRFVKKPAGEILLDDIGTTGGYWELFIFAGVMINAVVMICCWRKKTEKHFKLTLGDWRFL